MDEIRDLPDEVPIIHSSTGGALKRYQDKLVHQYLFVVAEFDRSCRDITNQAIQEMNLKMKQFNDSMAKFEEDQASILECINTAQFKFEEIQNKLEVKNEQIISNSQILRKECIEIYEHSFKNIKPLADSAFQKCQNYLSQVPEQFIYRLPNEIRRLNSNYLETKEKLLSTLFSYEIQTRHRASEIMEEFRKLEDEWKTNRFSTLIKDAREKLNPSRPLDFGNLFIQFHEDQASFTHCVHKLLTNVILIAPPDHFKLEDLENWWKEVNDLLQSHQNFVSQYLSKFQVEVDKHNQSASELLTSLESELATLKSADEASSAIYELTPLCRTSQKTASTVAEKLSKYWKYRDEALEKCFQAIKDFLQPIIVGYNKFVDQSNEKANEIQTKGDELTKASNEKLDDLEKQLNEKKEEIQFLVNQDEIKERVNNCKALLSQIEAEYHDYYQKETENYNGASAFVCTLFEDTEREILDHLQMKKTANNIELETSSRSSLSSRMASVRKRNDRRTNSRRVPTKKVQIKTMQASNLPSFSFSLPSGAKFEEISPLSIIPQFDDFIDEPQVSSAISTKRGGKNLKPPPKPIKKPIKKGIKNGKGIDEDIEVPEIIIQDLVPKIDGEISIWVYIPVNEELNEWTNNFRKCVLEELNTKVSCELKRSTYAEERKALSDQLAERMRVHTPRANSIELNVADARILEIASRQNKLETQFRLMASNFNQSYKSLETQLDQNSNNIEKELEKLKHFLTDLGTQKSSTSFVTLVQNLKISEKQYTTYVEKIKANEEKSIEQLLSQHNNVKERFVSTFSVNSKEEREMLDGFLSRMEEQVNILVEQLKEKKHHLEEENENNFKQFQSKFEAELPIQKADIIFVEALNTIQTEARQKYDSLRFRNKSGEVSVDKAIELCEAVNRGDKIIIPKEIPDPSSARSNISTSSNLSSTPKSPTERTPVSTPLDSFQDPNGAFALQKYFAALENLRVALINRGQVLSLLKSTLSNTKVLYSIDMLSDPRSANRTSLQSDQSTRSKRVKSKSKKEDKTSSKEKDKKGSTSKKASDTPSNSTPSQPQNDQTPLQVAFDELHSNLQSQINKLCTDYYSNVKNRKAPIRRTDLIKEVQQDEEDSQEKIWQKNTLGFAQLLIEAQAKFRAQVTTASTVARESATAIYREFGQFFQHETLKSISDVQNEFNTRYAELMQIRDNNKKQLDPRLADSNLKDELIKLNKAEHDRKKDEVEAINSFEQNIFNAEVRMMNLFTYHLIDVTQNGLNLFDGFMMGEDLVGGQQSAPRKTMKELLKDQQRITLNQQNASASGRPFGKREWPGIPDLMEPLNGISIQTSSNLRSTHSSHRKTKKSSKPDKGDKDKNDKVEKNDITSSKNGGSLLTSMETPLHRGLIVERNKAYEKYQDQLQKRIEDFKEYIDSMKGDVISFEDYWKKCLLKIDPHFNLQN